MLTADCVLSAETPFGSIPQCRRSEQIYCSDGECKMLALLYIACSNEVDSQKESDEVDNLLNVRSRSDDLN